MSVLETGKLEIGDVTKAIFHLGNVYEDPRDALAEFITNSIDARATQIVVQLHRRGAKGSIEITDDGDGMTASDLSRIARSLCDSIKADDERTVGEKGIGILGFQEIADECEIVSRTARQPATHTLHLKKGTREYTIVEAGKKPPVQGTAVRLSGVEKSRMRQFTLAKLDEHLKRKFRVHLLAGDVRITVVEGRKAVHVQPDHYKGVPFFVNEVRTQYGDIRLDLYVNPSGRSESVAVYHKGNLVLDSITQLDEFAGDPWASGKVTGEISNDFNKPTTGRSGFMHHSKKWPVWVQGIRGIEAQLQAEVDRLTREASEEADRQMHKRIREAFLRALAELPTFGGITSPIADPAGDEEHGEPGDEPTIQPPPTDHGPDGDGQDPRPPQPSLFPSETPINARAGVGFNLIEAPLNDSPDLHSDFNPSAVLIRVNTLHPDYQRERASQDRKESYLVRLIAKEMTLYEYPDTTPENLVEKLLDLELAARRNLEAGSLSGSKRNGRGERAAG
jgi:hypothetical protein